MTDSELPTILLTGGTEELNSAGVGVSDSAGANKRWTIGTVQLLSERLNTALYYWPLDRPVNQTGRELANPSFANISFNFERWEGSQDYSFGVGKRFDGGSDKGDATVPIGDQDEWLLCFTLDDFGGVSSDGDERFISWDQDGSFGVIRAQAMSDGSVRWSVDDGSSSTSIESETQVDDGGTYRVACRVDENNEIAVGIDSTIEITEPFDTVGPVSDDMGIGYDVLNDNSNLNGVLDDIVIYADSSDEQISRDYNLFVEQASTGWGATLLQSLDGEQLNNNNL